MAVDSIDSIILVIRSNDRSVDNISYNEAEKITKTERKMIRDLVLKMCEKQRLKIAKKIITSVSYDINIERENIKKQILETKPPNFSKIN